MNSKVIVIALSLVVVIAAAAVVFLVREPLPNESAMAIPSNYFDQSAATEDRVFALEAAVAQERNARLLLEEELQALYYELDELRSGPDEATEERDAAAELQREAMRERADRFRAGDTTQGRADMLIEAGFAPDRAEWIVQRESELQMDLMRAMFDARQSGERPDRSRLDPDQALRAELGDVEYEQYLEANGRSTAVAVGSVLESSPGQRAGLQSGDQIVGYNGQRVFSYGELSEQTMSATPGRAVVVDIVRDGVPMQVVVDAGPIGISNRGIRGRR
ncbi:MAG: PDZ domain-containing protein [Woeseiaceae bacterium]|nr:PDZ domain-containing protein [Woeseiaceae bacterium]